MTEIVTRFAPSPTGLLHPGHAWSALFASESAAAEQGKFLVRIENIDFTRCRSEFEAALLEDLSWLGLRWEQPVRRQTEHLSEYAAAADRLKSKGLLYPCFCTRKEILREIEFAGGAPHGPDGPIYPGTCRDLSESERSRRIAAGDSWALRFDVGRAASLTGSDLYWYDRTAGLQKAVPEAGGDIVLVRKDIGCSYHLAVVWDDAVQGVTRVTRGVDLFDATHVQRLLQAVLDLPTPEYHHHPVVFDSSGRRLAKRDGARSLRDLRRQGVSPADFRDRFVISSDGKSVFFNGCPGE